MSIIVWAAPSMPLHEAQILWLLKDAEFPVNLVEVSLFKESIFHRPERRYWEPAGDLAGTAKDISRYIADNGCVDVMISVSDEVYCFDPTRQLVSFNPTRRV